MIKAKIGRPNFSQGLLGRHQRHTFFIGESPDEVSCRNKKLADNFCNQSSVIILIAYPVDPSGDQRIPQKIFHAQIQHDFNALKKEEAGYKPIPTKQVHEQAIRETNLRIKREVKAIVEDEIDRIMNTPSLARIIVKK